MEEDQQSIEIIKDKLFWVSDNSPPKNKPNSSYFSIDAELVYEPFNQDFGPLNISMIHRYCSEVQRLLSSYPENHALFHYTSLNLVKRTNSALLICAYQIIVLKRTADHAWDLLKSHGKFLDYRDAGFGPCNYKCTILHCLKGLEKAIQLGWYDFTSFDVENYEIMQRIENGDLNWIIPSKFIAFSCPSNTNIDAEGFKCYTPEDYCNLFKTINITTVIRLNKKTYEASRFRTQNIKHYDLYFLDGSCPSDEIISKFLTICEIEKEAIAVHCKAGLGRTGTLIGIYAIKHFGFSAEAFIGWIRLCRPGSILGPQQMFLVEIENKLKMNGKEFKGYAKKIETFNEDIPKRSMSPQDFYKAHYGDKGQANRLIYAKRNIQSLTPGRKILSPIPKVPDRKYVSKKHNNNIFFYPSKNPRVHSSLSK